MLKALVILRSLNKHLEESQLLKAALICQLLLHGK
jgi:hypothetical protein